MTGRGGWRAGCNGRGVASEVCGLVQAGTCTLTCTNGSLWKLAIVQLMPYQLTHEHTDAERPDGKTINGDKIDAVINK